MSTAIVWFRRDLRLSDNPALVAGATHTRLIPLYIHDPQAEGEWGPGGATRWWLHHSLAALDSSLRTLGSQLIIREGDSGEILQALIEANGADHIYWNRCYEPALIARDSRLKEKLHQHGSTVKSSNAALLYEPWQLLKADETPYKVFTPFWKRLQQRGMPPVAAGRPQQLPPLPAGLASLRPEQLQLLPTLGWDAAFPRHWQPGETGAEQQLQHFIQAALHGYDEGRDLPSQPDTSRLSPHLHFGEISPRRIVEAITEQGHADTSPGLLHNSESYLRQLAWREFAYYLLYHFPDTPTEPFNPRFGKFRWERKRPAQLRAWQRGETGIPIVDAGMRELWQTGWMHNRVRMLAASLLTKNLLQHWHHGARWLHDTLVDADLAANSLGWQWVAGSGADAAPYFRIFNPVLQGEKFDKQGRYVRRWVPELAALPDKYLHRPWEAPVPVLADAGITLGRDYPRPIVDLKQSRQTALARYRELKQGRGERK